MEDEAVLIAHAIGDADIWKGRDDCGGGGVHEVESTGVVGLGEGVVCGESRHGQSMRCNK